MYWVSSTDLDITSELAAEWELYRIALQASGETIQDKEDILMWIGGDSSGYPTVKNAYLALLSTQNLSIFKGWRNFLWKWDIQQKMKLFLWWAAENKILT
jgi:hypothetical protein